MSTTVDAGLVVRVEVESALCVVVGLLEEGVSVGLGEGRRFARSGDSSVYGVDVDVVCGVCGSGDVVCVGCGGAAGGVIGGEPVLNHDRRWG